MRISYEPDKRRWITVDEARSGQPVVFKGRFHQDVEDGDVFIINTVPVGYVPEDIRFGTHLAVTNLRTGKLSWLRRDHLVMVVECHVVMEVPI